MKRVYVATVAFGSLHSAFRTLRQAQDAAPHSAFRIPQSAFKRVCVVTGSRGEYGILVPVLRAIESSSVLSLQLIAAGQHLVARAGHTVDQIRADGFSIDAEVPMVLEEDTRAGMARGLGEGIVGMTQAFERLDPDIVLVLGDRVEPFAAAIAAVFLGKVVAHIHGGDRSQGGLDEYMRHAITKLSHLHFTATELSRKRVLALGENADRVFCVGSPGLDALLRDPIPSDAEIVQALGASIPDRFILAVYHPVSTVPQQAVAEFKEILDALKESGIHVVLSYPNTDAGSRGIETMIDRVAREPWVTAYRSIPRPCYLALLRRCICLVGNSSSGMIDSPAFGIPAINVGSRQRGRERGTNVLDVPPDRSEILWAIRRAATDQEFIAVCRATPNPYGDGHASERIVAELEQVEIGPDLLTKEFPF